MFIKHIGKHGDRKVAVIFKQVPDEDHMALVVYTQLLKTDMHDAIMKIIESSPGQEAENLGDALFRNLFPDGRPMLEALHKEGMIKKVPTSQVQMTPNAASNIRLDELNKMLTEMNQGADAMKKLAELDASSGFVDPKVKRAAEAAFKESQKTKSTTAPLAAPVTGGLDDASIARDLRIQAGRMQQEAQSLMAESARLSKEASLLEGVTAQGEKPRRGRPPAKKVQAVDATQ